MPHNIVIDAPAKVNLYLKVLDKRQDRYHNIATIFERIDLADRIHIKKIPRGIEVSSNVPITRRKEDNLAYKAAKAILDLRVSSTPGIGIYIDKTIPIAAGLGGGSSDAASVLIGINKIFGLKLAKDNLQALGRRVGADVPFFLSQVRFAIGTARGDVITPIATRKIFYHLIIYPNFHLKTTDVYKKFDSLKGLSRDLTNEAGDAKIDAASLIDRFEDATLHNDLEKSAVNLKRELKGVIERLAKASGRKAVISGSGPSVFCLFKKRKEAEEAKEKLSKSLSTCEAREWRLFIARTA